jgi:hypothetical protein
LPTLVLATYLAALPNHEKTRCMGTGQ